MSPTAARIGWLYPAAREVYRVLHRLPPAVDTPCVRCGTAVTARGTGQRRALCFLVRDRGTEWRNRQYGVIHQGCIPPAGQDIQRIRPRRLPRAS